MIAAYSDFACNERRLTSDPPFDDGKTIVDIKLELVIAKLTLRIVFFAPMRRCYAVFAFKYAVEVAYVFVADGVGNFVYVE